MKLSSSKRKADPYGMTNKRATRLTGKFIIIMRSRYESNVVTRMVANIAPTAVKAAKFASVDLLV